MPTPSRTSDAPRGVVGRPVARTAAVVGATAVVATASVVVETVATGETGAAEHVR